MKKIISCLILILSSVVIIACGKDPSVSYKSNTITINMGYSYVISAGDIDVKNSTSEYEIISLNNDIAEVSGYIITPKKEGETVIRIQLVDNTSFKYDIRLIVTDITYATSAKVDSTKVYINLSESSESYNKIKVNEGCNEIPEVKCNREIIEYDYVTGKISAKALGQTSVVVLYKGCVASFMVYVTDVVYTKSMLVEDCTIIDGYSGRINFSIFPDNANTYNFFTMSNILSITPDGHYETNGTGTATVYCEYVKGPEVAPVMLMFEVTIIEHIDMIDFKIVEAESGQEHQYYLNNKKYKLIIEDSLLSTSSLSLVGGVTQSSQFVKENDDIYVEFYFSGRGEKTVQIDVSFDGNNVVMSKVKNYLVSRISDIQVKAKWSAYYQETREDGKYYITTSGVSDTASSLMFIPVIGDNIVYEQMIVYDITNGSRVQLNGAFASDIIGEYVFEFVMNGTTIGYCTVVVE